MEPVPRKSQTRGFFGPSDTAAWPDDCAALPCCLLRTGGDACDAERRRDKNGSKASHDQCRVRVSEAPTSRDRLKRLRTPTRRDKSALYVYSERVSRSNRFPTSAKHARMVR